MAALPGVGLPVDVSQIASAFRSDVLSGDTAGAGSNSAAGTAAAARGQDFGSVLGSSLNNLAALDQTASTKAVQAATGDLTDVHDYVIAATEAQTMTDLTTTVRNKALEAFNEIMRMPL